MKVQKVNYSQSFTNKTAYEKMKDQNLSFYNLYHDDKVDVVYDILQEQNKKIDTILDNQNKIKKELGDFYDMYNSDVVTLSKNQDKIMKANQFGFEQLLFLTPGAFSSTDISPAISTIRNFNQNKIDIIR